MMFFLTSVMGISQTKVQKTLVKSSENEIVVDVKIGDFFMEEVETPNGKQVVINAEDMASMLVKGAPDLPMFPISMIIGDHAEMAVSVVKSNYTDYENVEVAPSKGNFSRQINPNDVEYVYGEMYNQDAFYPASQASLETPYILRDFRGQNIMVYPYAYNPVTKTLRVYDELRIAVKKVSDNGLNQKVASGRSGVVSPEMKASYERRFINFSNQEKYDFIEDEGEMLVIYVNEYKDEVERLVEWKNISGRPTTMVKASETGSLDNMKDYIKNYYNEHPNLTFVLLIGEYSDLPPYEIGVYIEGLLNIAKSDNYYGMLEGDDFYEEVLVGRLSVKNLEDAKNQIDRIIYYERDIKEDATWLSRGAGISAKEGGGHFGEREYEHIDYIRDTLLNYTYTEVSQRYDGVNSYTVTASDIASDINNGVGIATYCDHGEEFKWVLGDFDTQRVHELKNDNMLPFIWSVACLNGHFDNDECFAESWLRSVNPETGAPVGAIGGMFSWISQPWVPPLYGQDEMVAILTEWRGGYNHTLGGASLNGNMYILDMCPEDLGYTHYSWLLFGDPSLMLRTKAPEKMDIVFDNTLYVGMTQTTVFVDAENAIATLSINDEVIASAKVSDGRAILNFPALTDSYDKAKLVVIGYNKVTEIMDVNISSVDGAHVLCESIDLNQNDGQADFGETIDLTLNVKNIGNASANNINVEVFSNSEYAVVVSSMATVASLQADETVSVNDAIQIFVANNVPDQTNMEFMVKCYDGSNTWTSYFYIVANAPVIEIREANIEGTMLAPGDDAKLNIVICNNGNSDIHNVMTEMFASSSDIVFDMQTIETEKIEAGQTVTITSDFNISSSAVNGAIYEVYFSVSSGYHIETSNCFITIGSAEEDFESGNFNSKPWQFDGDADWVICNDAYEGSYCAMSGDINDGQKSIMKMVVEFPYQDVVSFYRKLHCDYYDKLYFLVDGVEYEVWRGNNNTVVNWEQFSYTISQGTHTLEWRYVKDNSDTFGSDCVYIDNIELPSGNIVSTSAAVENLKAEVEENNVTLSWDGNGADEYIIKRDGAEVSTSSETSFVETLENGVYTYNVVSRKGDVYSMPAFVTVEVGTVVNVFEVEFETVEVYPNPTSGIVYVNIDKTFDAVVYNYQGQVVKKLYDINSQIDMTGLSYGIYFVEIRTVDDVFVEKIIVR